MSRSATTATYDFLGVIKEQNYIKIKLIKQFVHSKWDKSKG